MILDSTYRWNGLPMSTPLMTALLVSLQSEGSNKINIKLILLRKSLQNYQGPFLTPA